MLEKLNGAPEAYADVRGSYKYPDLHGMVYFYEVHGGTIVVAEIYGLPDEDQQYLGKFFGFHVHEGAACAGPPDEPPFADTLTHYSPEYAEHPQHVGDLPVLLSSHGMAWLAVYTGRFFPDDVIGRTVVIHDHPDDYRSQPFGNAGEKIACGEIKEWGSQFTTAPGGIVQPGTGAQPVMGTQSNTEQNNG
ncbi:superoxide dismutase family protein [Clostridium sp. C105KSO13]|uniref:superoxide dismutase family protein n=1 Tax=Clostridium sp. C105KSO13 TaxID=1776045 RepID=UPI00074061F4|nr:Superoxide dismutase [Cu-Zn] precursor [Clostridium sp. C105KSO13]